MSRDLDPIDQANRDALDPGSWEWWSVQLSDAGLLTERQADAIALRVVKGVSRRESADAMNVSPNVLDKHLRAGRDKIESACHTLDVLDGMTD